MKQLLLILSLLITCTAAQAQRYRVVADSTFVYKKGYPKLYEVIHYAYSGDRGSNATNDTVDYDTCIVYRYNRMVFYDSGRRPPIIYERSSKPRLAEKTVRVRNAQGQIDTVYHYKPVLRDTLDLASITVYNRRPDGQPYAKDVYGLVYCQPPDKEVPMGEPEEDTLIDGEWHYAIPQAYAPVAQPKVAAGYRITQKDSFEYKDGVGNTTNEYDTFFRYEYEYGEPMLTEKRIKIKDEHGLVDSVYQYRAVLGYELDIESITVHNRDGNGLLRSTDVYGLVYRKAQLKDSLYDEVIGRKDTVIDGAQMTIVRARFHHYNTSPKMPEGYIITQKDSFEYKDGNVHTQTNYKAYKAVTDIRGKTLMSPYRKHTYTYEQY